MNLKKVVIRLDGDSDIGLGHIYRGLALADILKRKFGIEFVVRTSTTISPIKESGFDYTFIPATVTLVDEPNWFKENYTTDSIIVLDGYSFTKGYQKKIKELNYKLVYIDDLVEGKQVADLVINHCPGVKESDYKIEEGTKLALGLNFALLRKSFIEFNRNKAIKSKKIENIFISFGGADSYDFSYKVAKEVLKLDFIKTINIVLGAAYKNNTIFSLEDTRLKIVNNLSEVEVFKLMKSIDLAIVPASNTSIELASLGIPMILGYFVDNQKRIYQGFISNNSVTGVENYNIFNFESLGGLIEAINTSGKLKTQQLKLLNFFNNSIKNNILELFKFNSITIRKACDVDMTFVFNLSNESIVRLNSYNTNKIELNEHKEWFSKQIKKNDVLFYIIEFQNNSIGQIRFNIKEDYSVIGISISNSYRGKGLASESLKLAVSNYFQKNSLPIYAYIKKTNKSSVTLFEKNKFSFYKEDIIEGIDSYIYKKEK